jgi:hypothetical protein
MGTYLGLWSARLLVPSLRSVLALLDDQISTSDQSRPSTEAASLLLVRTWERCAVAARISMPQEIRTLSPEVPPSAEAFGAFIENCSWLISALQNGSA